MDAFAHKYHQTNRVPWISVNWDAWRFEGERERKTAMGATLAQLAMTPEEGMEAFQRVLSLDSINTDRGVDRQICTPGLTNGLN